MGIYGNINEDLDYQAIQEAVNIINEAYVGKTETLLKAEEALHNIRQNLKIGKDMDKMPEVLAFNRLIEKQFGMDVFVLHIDQSDTINAWTMPIGIRFDIALKTNASKLITGTTQTGFRYVEGNNLCIVCTVCMGILGNPVFTDEEVLAVILHELGHNISCCIYNRLRLRNEQAVSDWFKSIIAYAFLIITIPHAISIYRNNTNKLQRRKGKKIRMNPLRGWLNGLAGNIDSHLNFKSEVRARLSGGRHINNYKDALTSEDPNIKANVRKSLGRQDEVIADKVAGIYGYGPAQGSALLKMHAEESKAEKYVKSLGAYEKKKNSEYNEAMLDICDYDVHPHVIQRIHEEMKVLEGELQRRGHDPKYEKVIKSQIAQLKKQLMDNIKVASAASKDERTRANYYKLVHTKQPDAITNELEDIIEDLLNTSMAKGNNNDK